MTPTIWTIGGRYFDFRDPRIKGIEEIATALSNLCRFTGHVKQFYSVAQHSVHVSRMVPRHLALQALLHDAHEAFIGDCSAPLKLLLPDYQAIEARVATAVREAFGVPVDLAPEVVKADRIALMTEKRDLLIGNPDVWYTESPDPWALIPLGPENARVPRVSI